MTANSSGFNLPDPGYFDLIKGSLGRLTSPALRLYTRGGKCRDRIVLHENGTWNALKLRLRIRNTSWFFDIPGCQVFLRRIEGPSGLLETESTRLVWSLEPDREQWFAPKLMLRGSVGERYVDLCSVDERNLYLQVMSERFLRGDHRFTRRGTYVLHVQPIAPGRRHGPETPIRVSYNPSDWLATEVLDAL